MNNTSGCCKSSTCDIYMTRLANCSLAASRRGQFVTNCVEPPTSFGPLDRNCDSNCSLSNSPFVGRGHDPADQVGQSSSIFVQNRPISGKTRRSCNVTLRRGHDPALQWRIKFGKSNYNLSICQGSEKGRAHRTRPVYVVTPSAFPLLPRKDPWGRRSAVFRRRSADSPFERPEARRPC